MIKRLATRNLVLKTRSVIAMRWSNTMQLKKLKRPNNQRKLLIQKIKKNPNLSQRMLKIKQPLKKPQRRMVLKSRPSPPVRHLQRLRKKMLRNPLQRIRNQLKEPNLHPKRLQRALKERKHLVKIPKNRPVRKKIRLHQQRDKRRRVHQRQSLSQMASRNRHQRPVAPSLVLNQLRSMHHQPKMELQLTSQ